MLKSRAKVKTNLPDIYTVMIVRTGRSPTFFSIRPIAIWLSLASLLLLLGALIYFAFAAGKSSNSPSSALTGQPIVLSDHP